MKSVPTVPTAGAVVLRLPTAGLPAIRQTKVSGRHPKGVAALWRERMKRSIKLREFELLAARERAVAAREECLQRGMAATAALKAAQAEDLRLEHEYEAFNALVKQIDADIAILAGGQGAAA